MVLIKILQYFSKYIITFLLFNINLKFYKTNTTSSKYSYIQVIPWNYRIFPEKIEFSHKKIEFSHWKIELYKNTN